MSQFSIRRSVPVSASSPIDWAHLDRATMGDRKLADEVLELFVAQSVAFEAAIRDQPKNAASLVHKLKGSARGIGAWPVADAAQKLEAALSAAADAGPSLTTLLAQIEAASSAIKAHLRET